MKTGITEQQAQFEKLVTDLSAVHTIFYASIYREGETEKEVEDFINTANLEGLDLDRIIPPFNGHVLSELLSASHDLEYMGIQGELVAKLCRAVLAKNYAKIDWNKTISAKPYYIHTLFGELCRSPERLKEIILNVINECKIDWNQTTADPAGPMNSSLPLSRLLNSDSAEEYIKAILYSPQNDGNINFNTSHPYPGTFIEHLFNHPTTKNLAVLICLSHHPMPKFDNPELKQAIEQKLSLLQQKLIALFHFRRGLQTNEGIYLPDDILSLIKDPLIAVELGLNELPEKEMARMINRIIAIHSQALLKQAQTNPAQQPILTGYQGSATQTSTSSSSEEKDVEEKKTVVSRKS